jgi:hypothetical protein
MLTGDTAYKGSFIDARLPLQLPWQRGKRSLGNSKEMQMLKLCRLVPDVPPEPN